MNYCETCFEKVAEVDQHGDCKGCAKPPQPKDEKWIDVPSPFKAYPESEGV